MTSDGVAGLRPRAGRIRPGSREDHHAGASPSGALQPWPDLAGALDRGGPEVSRVELKALVCAASYRRLLDDGSAALRRRVRTRQVYFLDTAELALRRCGVVLRVRRTHTGGDVVVKLRRRRPVDLGSARSLPDLQVELDALPGHTIWSAALSRRLEPGALPATPTARWPTATLLSADQQQFLHTYAGLQIDDAGLQIHGPIEVTRTRVRTRSTVRLVLEHWALPGSNDLVEVSTKCRPTRALARADAVAALLADHGIEPATHQQTKTDAALTVLRRHVEEDAGCPQRRARWSP